MIWEKWYPLRMKRKDIITRIAWWLIHHGWQYSITNRRTIVLATIREQFNYLRGKK